MKYRKLRIAWSVVWGIVALLLCAGWAFAFLHSEFVANRLNTTKVLTTIAFNRGSLAYSRFDAANQVGVTREGTHVGSSTPPFGWKLGLCKLKSSTQSFLWQSSNPYLIVQAPYWSLVLPAILFAGAPWGSRRFTLRTLLIATTLIAVVLGLVVWLR
jgi:hypothetical protein